jgi:hypothetical protein
MSFLRHREIFPSDEDASVAGALAHRLDEFPAGYSLAGCAPALPASASPTASEYAVALSCRSMTSHAPVNCVLTKRRRAPSVLTETGRHERLTQGRGSTATADKHLVRKCPFLTMVPVMAVSDLVAAC